MPKIASKIDPTFAGAVLDADRVSETADAKVMTGEERVRLDRIKDQGTRYLWGKRVAHARVSNSYSLGDAITEDGTHFAKYSIRVKGAPWQRGSDGFWNLDLTALALPRYKFPAGDQLDGSAPRFLNGQRVRYAITDPAFRFALAVTSDGQVYIPKLISPSIPNPATIVYSRLNFSSGDYISVKPLRYHRGRKVRRAWADASNRVSLAEYDDGTVYIAKLSSPALDLAGATAPLDTPGWVFNEVVVGGQKQLQRINKTSGRRSLATSGSNNYAPRLSQDGTKLLYASDRSGTREGWYQLLDGTKYGSAVEHPVMPRLSFMPLGDSMTAGLYADLVAAAFGRGTVTPSSVSITGTPTAGGGIGSQRADQIAARYGAAALTCSLAGNAMTAGANTVTAVSIPLLGRSADTQGAVRTLRASILGVSGVLAATHQTTDANSAIQYDGSNWYLYTFTPDAGQALPGAVPAGNALIIDPEDRQDCVLLVWIGRNNVGTAGWRDEVKARLAAIIAAYKPLVRHIGIIGVTNSTSEPAGSANYNDIVAHNQELAALYPGSFIDVRPAYNAGTATDIPHPDRTADGLHYNNAGRIAIANTVINFITAQGWFA